MHNDQPGRRQDQPTTARYVPDTQQAPLTGTSGASQRTNQDNGLQGAPEGLGSLVNDVIADVQNIVRNEVRLAQAELKDDVGTLVGAAAMGVGAALAGLVGFIVLVIGVALFIDQWLNDWLSFIVAGAGLLVIAGILAMVAKSRVSAASLKPERTIDSLQQDKAWAQEQAQSLKEDQT